MFSKFNQFEEKLPHITLHKQNIYNQGEAFIFDVLYVTSAENVSAARHPISSVGDFSGSHAAGGVKLPTIYELPPFALMSWCLIKHKVNFAHKL
jgi:hypothetical protein